MLKRILISTLSILIATVWVAPPVANAAVEAEGATGYELRFYGNGTGFIDRVEIPIDVAPRTIDVGVADFTLEWWMKASLADNTAAGPCSAADDDWITGNILIDRDVFGSGDNGDYGVSLKDGKVEFGANNGTTGATACGSTVVTDDTWHHVAVTRKLSDGTMNVFVDGTLDGTVAGPTGDLSYDDGRATVHAKDPYLVLGAEKHDAGPSFPSYNGYMDEFRVSSSLRYTGSFSRPTGEFTADGATAGLFHFNEGSGTTAVDAAGGTDGEVKVGGTPTGPEYVSPGAPITAAGPGNSTRLSGSDRYATATAISADAFGSKTVDALVVASGEVFADALPGGVLAAEIGGPLLLTKSRSLPSVTAAEIVRVFDGVDDSTTDVYLLGGTAAVADAVASSITSLDPKIDLKRIAGSDRIHTSVLIAEEIDTLRGKGPSEAVVSYSDKFADASAVASAAANKKVNSSRMPILLNKKDSLDGRVETYLMDQSGTLTGTYVTGGTAVIAEAVVTTLENIVGTGTATRLSGSDRYATAAAIGEYFYGASNAPKLLGIATGLQFPDILSGGPYAASKNMPILYVQPTSVPAAVTSYIGAHASTLTDLVVFGGTAAISSDVESTVAGML